MKTSSRSLPKKTAVVAFSLFLPLLAIEAYCRFMFLHPQCLPTGLLLYLLRGIYLNNRDFIQYNSRCARYDAWLTYTLRPGRCTFSNVEFSTVVRTNRAGLRDDEASLRAPEIVVLGDSYAMGWGVQQEEAFPQVLERRLQRKVLNAGIASYGTAREIEILKRIGVVPKMLILQYCPNDLDENRHYVANGYRLSPSPAEVYGATMRELAPPQRYVPGHYLARTFEVQVLQRIWKPSRARSSGPDLKIDRTASEADLFVDILEHSGVALDQIPIYVLEVDAYPLRGGEFLQSVAARARRDGRLHLQVIDLSRDLSAKHFFRLDDHLNASGHRVVADRLYKAIREIPERPILTAAKRSLSPGCPERSNSPAGGRRRRSPG
jgi:lysophospholipase L1-like esterase